MLRTALKDTRKLRRGSRRSDTREQILDEAEKLLRSRGYNAFSYKHIAVRLDIRNAAIHYHFPTKEDLGQALMQRFRARFNEWREGIESEADNAWDLLQAYFSICHEYLLSHGKICPGGVFGPEFEAIPESMQDEAKLLSATVYDWLISVLERGAQQGEIRYMGAAEDKALQIGAALQGATHIARLRGVERFERVVAQLVLELAP